MKKLKNKKGFTLMEMLIVVAIIVILVAIAIPTFSGALTKARVATTEANLRAWYAEQMAAYLLDETDFPAALPATVVIETGTAAYVAPTDTAAGSLTYTPPSDTYDAITWEIPINN